MLIGGYDIVFDVVGIPETLNNAIRWTKAFGTVILVGVYLHRMKIDLSPIWYQEVNLKGAIGHDVVPWKKQLISTFDLAMLWMNKGIIETEVLLTHRFALDEYKAAFETALDKKGKKSIKVVFDIS
jgi:threonine dehydrogenase-like Zn-dependent dehydrogenase